MEFRYSRENAYPTPRGSESPWGWWISHLCARYRFGHPVNPIGPHVPGHAGQPEPTNPPPGYDPARGNPSGAYIDALEILNEPNLQMWPQQNLWSPVSEMVVTAEAIATFWQGPSILAPSTSDEVGGPNQDGLQSANGTDATPTGWRTFTLNLLVQLQNLRPRIPFGWSVHNYEDIRQTNLTSANSRIGQTGTAGPPERRGVRKMLYELNWKGGGDRNIWITEGGFRHFRTVVHLRLLREWVRDRAKGCSIRRTFVRDD